MKQVFGLLVFFSVSLHNLVHAQCSSVTVEAYQVSVGNYKLRATVAFPVNQIIYINGSITPEPGAPTDSYDLTIPAGSLTGETETTWQLTDPYAVPQFTVAVSPCPFLLSEDESQQVLLSYEFQNFVQSRNDFLDKIAHALSRGISLNSIRDATLAGIQNDDYQSLYSLLSFSSSQDGESFFNSLANARNSFLQAYPDIQQHLNEFICQSCSTSLTDQVNYFFNNFDAINTYRYSPGSEEGQDPGTDPFRKPTCGSFWNQLKLGICAAGCSVTTAGVATPFCGWLCWCAFCTQNSALASVICAN